MKYSFVLPAYKATYLKQAIDSILSQTYKEYELIIVNDASPEDIDAIIDSYNDDRIRYYVNSENIGGKDLVAQWNHSISYASGEYLILASDDDIYSSTFLEDMDLLVEKYPNVGVFRPRVQEIDKDGKIISTEGDLQEYMSQILFTELWVQGLVKRYVPEYIFKRKNLEEIGGFIKFPLAWFSDDATVIELAKDGIVLCEKVLFSFRNSGLNISSLNNNHRQLVQKCTATVQFYEWLERMSCNMQPSSAMESQMLARIREFSNYRKIDHLVWLMKGSGVYVRMSVINYIYRNRLVSRIELLKILYRLFI